MKRFGQCSVSKTRIEGVMPSVAIYDLSKRDIVLQSRQDWVNHMSEKRWVCLEEFTNALDYFLKWV